MNLANIIESLSIYHSKAVLLLRDSEILKYNMNMFKRFILYRTEDACGVSGTGKVAEGIQFSSNKCVISWISKIPSVEVYDSIDEISRIHGHSGKTEVRWIDSAD